MKYLFITGLFLFSLNSISQIIIDHTAVDLYEEIPQQYIDSIKKMWVTVPGESHSSGYRKGLQFLEDLDSTFQVNVLESGTPEEATNEYLRFSRATWGTSSRPDRWRYGYGEADWYTSKAAIEHTKAHLTYCDTTGFKLDAMGFGWCWDMTWQNGAGGEIDTVFQVRWAGSSEGGPQGSMRWGLDAEDSILTGNSVGMDDYINATMDYIQHCENSGYPTQIFFTTGPVDGGGNTGERGYQRYLKHEYIRQHVQNSNNLYLFDYADILTWGDDGTQNTTTWTDYGGNLQTFPFIHSDNMLDLDGTYEEDGDHIGERGALRIAKALWYMLARMAGWEGIVNEYITKINSPICQGDSILIGDDYIYENGTYYDTLEATDGLDSILIFSVTVNLNYEITIDTSINEGDSILIAETYQKEQGTYIDTLQTMQGCDSIVSYNLTIIYPCLPTIINIDTSINEGDSILIGQIYYTEPGVYIDTQKTVSGCDSIINIEIYACLQTLEYDPQDIVLCEGDSMLINGIYRKTEDSYTEIYTDKNGCDSVIIINLSFISCQDTTDTTENSIDNFNNNNVKVFPNPASDIVTIKHVKPCNKYDIIITSITGKTLYYKKDLFNITQEINISEFPGGVYLLKVINDKFIYTRKIFKQ